MSAAIHISNRPWATAALLATALAAGALITVVGVQFSPLLSLAAVVGIGSGLLFLRYPDLALYVLVALIPIERFGRFTDDNTQFTISLMRIMGLVTVGVLLTHRFLRQRPLTFGPAFWLYAGYVAVGLLSIVYTNDMLGTVRGASTIVGNLMFFFVVVNMATTRKHIFISLIIWLTASIAIGMYTVYDWHFGSGRSETTVMQGSDDPGKGVQTTENRWATVWTDQAELDALGGKSLRRSMGPTSHAVVYGINCILTVPFLLYLLRLPIGLPWKCVSIASLALIGYNVLLTNTRASILLAGLVGLLCVVFGLVRLRPGQAIAVILVVLASIPFIPQDIFNRILDLSNYTFEQSASLRIRMEYVEAGLRAAADNWLYGSGLANENIVPEYLNTWSTAPARTTVHNEYLQTLMEVGVIGSLFFWAFVILLFYYAFSAARNFARQPGMAQERWFMVAVQIAMIGTVIFGLQVDVFHFPLKGWWLLAGITVTMYRFSYRPDEPESQSEASSNQQSIHDFSRPM